ncbi:MAG: hypothetical protein AAFP81_07235 [Pseudomonadota bacterium]
MAHRTSTLNDIGLSIASALVLTGLHPSTSCLYLVDAQESQESIGQAEAIALAAMYGFSDIGFVRFPFEIERVQSIFSESLPCVLSAPEGVSFVEPLSGFSGDQTSQISSILDAQVELTRRLKKVIFELMKEMENQSQSRVKSEAEAQKVAVLAASRALMIGDFRSSIHLRDASNKNPISFCAAKSVECRNAAELFAQQVRGFVEDHDATLVVFEESYLSRVNLPERQTSLVEIAQELSVSSTTDAGNWLLGLKIKDSFRGVVNLVNGYDDERRLVILADQTQSQGAPIMVPAGLLDDDSIEIEFLCSDHNHRLRIPFSKPPESEQKVICYVDLIRNTPFARVYDFKSNVSSPHRIVLSDRSRKIVGMKLEDTVPILSEGFLHQ